MSWPVILLWAGLGWLGYVYLGYPIALGALAIVRRRRSIKREDFLPTVSVLIAARNEEKDIGWKIQETLQWNYPADRVEVLVASDASDDATDDIVQALDDLRIRLVRMQVRGGKGRALNALAPLANGELLFFTDANAHVDPNALRFMAAHFADERVGCVTGDSRAVQEESAALSSGAAVYWGYETLVKRCEDRLGSVLVCDGAIFCIRKSLFSPLAPELANDLELPVRIGAVGSCVRHEPRALVLENETTAAHEEFARRRRIIGQGALGAWKLRSQLRGLRAWQFASHKVLRWGTMLPMIFILTSAFVMRDQPVYRALLAGQMLFYFAALVGWVLTSYGARVPRLLAIPFYVVLGVTASVAGVVDALAGRKYDIWEIPARSRGRIAEQSSTLAKG